MSESIQNLISKEKENSPSTRRYFVMCAVGVSIMLAATLVNTLTYNFYYLYGHIDASNFVFVIAQIFKLTAVLLLPLAVFFGRRTPASLAKIILPAAVILSFVWCKQYFSLEKIPQNAWEELYKDINSIIPKGVMIASFFTEAAAMLFVCGVLTVRDRGIGRKEFRSLIYLPAALLLCLPLNIFENISAHFSEGVRSFFLFDNYNVWHFVSILAAASIAVGMYFFLKKKNAEDRRFYLSGFAIVLMLQFLSKNSMLVGDGYNVYFTLISALPLFICNIGVFVTALSIFTGSKRLYSIAFFVHAVGALSVFFYMGKDSNFGTVFDFSFLYFTVTHALLFALCIMPTALKMYRFRLKNCALPLVFFFCFTMVAAVSSAAVSAVDFVVPGTDEVLHIYPNFAFTQINPLPIPVPDFSVTIGGLTFDPVYTVLVYLFYLGLFFTFYGLYRLYLLVFQKIQKRIMIKAVPPPDAAAAECAFILDPVKDEEQKL